MNQAEAAKHPMAGLVIFSLLFLFVGVPALIVGSMDKENRLLFVIVAVFVVPQMVALWVCTVIEYIKRKSHANTC